MVVSRRRSEIRGGARAPGEGGSRRCIGMMYLKKNDVVLGSADIEPVH